MKYYNISLVGAGHLAWHLAQELESAGHTVVSVYSRHLENAQKLAARLYNTEATDSLDFRESGGDVFIVAVGDDALESVGGDILIPESAIIAHTSGTQPMAVLSPASAHIGVLYPLQTFSKTKNVNFSEIPICLEYNSDKGKDALTSIALSLSKQTVYLDSQQRMVLHLGAVIACNFANHLWFLASTVLESEEVDFALLHPLMKETLGKALSLGPEAAQTGPALRRDFGTLKKHQDYLASNPELARLYKLLSESIIRNY